MRTTLAGLAGLLAAGLEAHEHRKHERMERAARIVADEAKALIGSTEVGAAAPFAAWPELAQSTQDDREAHGYARNEMLLREGTLRDSIEIAVGDNEAAIGSNDPVAVYQELGTKSIPPRSFLGQAAVRKEREVVDLLGHGAARTLISGGKSEEF
jgi:phage gpG-like protein